MTRVYFVRHAQPEHDWEEDRTRPLTEEGKKDSAIVLEFLKDKKIDAFYCSPYKRSVDTIADAAAFFGKEIITDERLPIEWYYEWIVLGIIGYISYLLAYDKVGILYHEDFISGRTAGSFFHWIIRSIYFVIMWAITYGVIWITKFVIAHKVQFAIGICGGVVVVIAIKLFIWIRNRIVS